MAFTNKMLHILSTGGVIALVVVLCFSFACAERDFNFNDTQISLLDLKEEPVFQSNEHPYALESARCHYSESEIILSLTLKNHDWSDFSESRKNKVLDKLSKFFAIPKEFLRVESVTKRDMYEMQKRAIKKGQNKCHGNRRLGQVEFMLGCGPKYFSMGEPIANQIGHQMKDGSINNISGEKFGWWIIWRKDYKMRAQRLRRQIEGSGEDEYDDDSYDYDDEDEENVEPVTVIPPTTTHAHRHHHGSSKEEADNSTSLPEDNQVLPNVSANANVNLYFLCISIIASIFHNIFTSRSA